MAKKKPSLVRAGSGRRQAARRRILILHGPNLNLLGTREPHLYGRTTLAEIDLGLAGIAADADAALESFQSNHEGALVDRVHLAREQRVSYIIVNAGAYTHTSIALRDALAGAGIPFIEVHLSNVFAREPFRHHSLLSDLAAGVVCGLGAQGYELALRFVLAQK
jgi:3-dehydroquinate dehydratase-2